MLVLAKVNYEDSLKIFCMAEINKLITIDNSTSRAQNHAKKKLETF